MKNLLKLMVVSLVFGIASLEAARGKAAATLLKAEGVSVSASKSQKSLASSIADDVEKICTDANFMSADDVSDIQATAQAAQDNLKNVCMGIAHNAGSVIQYTTQDKALLSPCCAIKEFASATSKGGKGHGVCS